MIYFITKQTTRSIEEIEGVLEYRTPQFFLDYDFSKEECIGLDFETNGLDAYINSPLLLIVGNEVDQFVVNCLDFKLELIGWFNTYKNSKFLGHNLKFDIKFVKVHYYILLENLYDTMIAEQRLLQGYGFTNDFDTPREQGFLDFKLDSIIKRRLGFLPEGMDKNIRMEFVGVNSQTFEFKTKHILYGAEDIKHLFAVKKRQEELMIKAKQEFLIKDIEFKLIPILAEAELEGWILNEEKWLAVLTKNMESRFEHQCKLDVEFRKLRDRLLNKEESACLRNGVYDRQRQKKQEVVQEGLFDLIEKEFKEVEDGKEPKNSAYINYGSTTQLIYILGKLKQPVPTKEGLYNIPEFKIKKGKEIIDKDIFQYSTAEGAMETYLGDNPNSPIKDFINLLIEYRSLCTKINTFGKTFLNKYKNKITDRVHTIFRQCTAITGRLQSGSKDEGYINSQNIPADNAYRECFGVEEGYGVITADYSGCEAVVMIDKARDEVFYQMAIVNDDAHSPIAQAVWRAIGNYRANNLKSIIDWGEETKKQQEKDLKDYKEAIQLSTIIVSKKINKDKRTEYKNNTFAVIYGCGVKKYAKTLKVSEEEGKIGMKVQKAMMPKTIQYLDKVAKQATSLGQVTINTRTNSRVWYPKIFYALKNNNQNGNTLEFRTQVEVESSARNIQIQGTNADLVKEAMVELTREFKERNLDAKIIGQAHDEIITKYNLNIELIEVFDDGQIKGLTFGEFVQKIMEDVANRYLNYIKMKVEFKSGITWTK